MKHLKLLIMLGLSCTLVACNTKENEVASDLQSELASKVEQASEVTISEKQSSEDMTKEIPTNEDVLNSLISDDEIYRVTDYENKNIPDIKLKDIIGKDTDDNVMDYARFKKDNHIFEFVVTDKEVTSEFFMNEAYLVITDAKNDKAKTIISCRFNIDGCNYLDNEFASYNDVNFDGEEDLIINEGMFGNQGVTTCQAFIKIEGGYRWEESYSHIANPIVDNDNKLILSSWRNSAVSHSWAFYEYKDESFIQSKVLTEELINMQSETVAEDVWQWEVDGTVIGTSDKLTKKKIDDLIYNEKNEWGLSTDRWNYERIGR